MNYPYVRYPEALNKVFAEDFNSHNNISKPALPAYNLPQVIGVKYIWYSIGVFIVAIISGSVYVLLISAILMLLSSLIVVSQKKKLKSAVNKQKMLYELYIKECNIYQQNLNKHDEFVRNLNDVNWKKNYKRHLINQIFLNSTVPKTTCTSTKGLTEDFFHKYLTSNFQNLEIYTDRTIYQNRKNLMIPDFIIHEKSSNIFIDVEIDEPYTYKTREPIHYFNDDERFHSDEYRDHFFTGNNWIVIRFAEEQITDFPMNCCKFVDAVLRSLTNPSCTTPLDINKEPLKKIECWNKEFSMVMERINYREDYLFATNDILILNKLNQNSPSLIGTYKRDLYILAKYYANIAKDEV